MVHCTYMYDAMKASICTDDCKGNKLSQYALGRLMHILKLLLLFLIFAYNR